MSAQVHTEKELLTRIANGDQSAFKALYDQYWEALYKTAYRRMGDAQRAEDVVQEVFFRLWAKREKLVIENPGAYLHRAVRNEVLDQLARSSEPTRFYELFETILLETNHPEFILRSKELLELIALYAASLPAKRRAIFLLHIDSRLNTKEIAEKLQISQKTVQNQLATALAGLRDHLSVLITILLANR